MTHTNEFLRGMFAAYMGCEVMVYETKATILSVSLNSLYLDGEGDTANVDFEFCKPILTPLSEITDEDAVEVAKIFKYQVNEIDKLIILGKELIEALTRYELDGFQLRDILAITDYLRSKHYDCGYMHIQSLIQADLAISSKQI